MTTRLSLTVPDSLAVARFKLDLQRPYLSKALWALQPVAMPELGVTVGNGYIGTDRWWRLYYNPEIIAGVAPDELCTLLCHELFAHHLNGYFERGDAFQAEPTVWNVAGDLAANCRLAEEKMPFPTFPGGGKGVFPKDFGFVDNLFSEEYYDLLMKNAVTVMVRCPTGGGCGPESSDTPYGLGPPAPLDLKNPTPRGEAPGVSSAEAEIIRKQVAEDVQSFKQRGTVPGWLDRWATELLHPKADWKRLLRATVRHGVTETQGAVDYSWKRPNRRQHTYAPFIMPTLRRPQPRVAFVIDTSGSMSNPELAQGIAEVDAVLKTLNANVTVMSVDAAVHVVKDVRTRKDVKLQGGGGTDMRLGIDAAVALKPRPHLIVVVTDCATPWPDTRPQIPVIIVKTSEGGSTPEWATTIEVFDKK